MLSQFLSACPLRQVFHQWLISRRQDTYLTCCPVDLDRDPGMTAVIDTMTDETCQSGGISDFPHQYISNPVPVRQSRGPAEDVFYDPY